MVHRADLMKINLGWPCRVQAVTPMSTARRSPAFLAASRRRAMAVLALVALVAVLLRPLCDALEPIQAAAAPSGVQQSHHSPEEPCCASIADGSFAPSSAAAFPFDDAYDVIPRRALPSGSRLALRRAALDPPRRPPRPVPFHARTARILA